MTDKKIEKMPCGKCGEIVEIDTSQMERGMTFTVTCARCSIQSMTMKEFQENDKWMEIKPCYRCGGEMAHDNNTAGHYVYCTKCNISFGFYYNLPACIREYNENKKGG